MTVIAETVPASRPARWVGRILSGLVIVFLMVDGAIKLVPWPIVTETMDRMGYGSSDTRMRGLGAGHRGSGDGSGRHVGGRRQGAGVDGRAPRGRLATPGAGPRAAGERADREASPRSETLEG